METVPELFDSYEALLASDKVKKTYEARQKECKGVNTGDVSARCEKLDKELPFLGALLKKEQDMAALADQLAGGKKFRS